MNDKKEYKKLGVFKGWVLQNFPYIEADFDALTNYELICKITEYINKIHYNQEALQENQISVENDFKSLNTFVTDYFKNLNVQDEIDNKIDEMTKDGIFDDYVINYVNPILESQNEKIELQNDAIKEQNEKIAKTIGINPIAVNSIAEMIDKDKIYVNTSDGKWYYYNDQTSVWDVGGVYQSTEVAYNSITLDKIDFNTYQYSNLTAVNKQLLGYTSDFIPRFSDEGNYYTAIIQITDKMPDLYFNLANLNGQILVPYTENEKASNQTYATITNNSIYYVDYNSLTNICKVKMQSLYNANYRMLAIQLNPNNTKIWVNSFNGSNINIPITNFISGSNIKNNTISKDNLNFKIYDVTDDLNYIRSDRLENVVSANYNTTNRIPNKTTNNNARTVIAPIFGPGIIRISKDSLFIQSQSQLYLLYENGSVFYNVTNQVLNSYLQFPTQILYQGNILYTVYQDYIDFNLDYINTLNIKSIFITFNSRKINNAYVKYLNSYKPNWLIENNEVAYADIIMPSKMRVIKGIEANVYYQNIVRYFDTNFMQRVDTSAMISPYKKYLRMNKNKENIYSTNMNVKFFFNNTDYAIKNKSIYVEAVDQNAGAGQTKKVLFIGDSMTKASYYPNDLINMFSNDDMNIELIGTEGSAPANFVAFNGWRAYTYCYCENGKDDNGTTGLIGKNPFFNPETKEFDFTYFMNNNNYDNVDYVFLNIGTNDWTRSNHITESEILSYYNFMINSIKKYNSAIKICLWLPPTKGMMSTDNKKLIDMSLRSQILAIKYFDNRENENIFLVPVYFNVDPEHDYPYKEENVSNDNTLFKHLVCTDRTHPSQIGYQKIADVIFTYIKYLASLD